MHIAKCVSLKQSLVNSETLKNTRGLFFIIPSLFPEPSAAPNVKNFHISDSCKKVRWEALPKSSLNGVLTKYTLVLKKINEEERESFTTEKEKFRLPNLKPFTHYCLQIAASNHAGSGPMSDDFTFCTPEKGIL